MEAKTLSQNNKQKLHFEAQNKLTQHSLKQLQLNQHKIWDLRLSPQKQVQPGPGQYNHFHYLKDRPSFKSQKFTHSSRPLNTLTLKYQTNRILQPKHIF